MSKVAGFPGLLLAASMLVSGCAEWEQHMRDTLPPPQPAYANREIVVAPTRSVQEVRFAGAATAVSREEQAGLAGFLDQVSPDKSAVVLIEQSGRRADRLARQRVVALTQWVRAQGYRTAAYDAPAEGAAPGVLRVAVDHTLAMVPGCPDWQFHNYFAFGAQMLPNQGCADRTNLAAMVVNPNDLVAGAVPHAAAGHGLLAGEVRYRQNAVTPPRDAQAAESTSSN